MPQKMQKDSRIISSMFSEIAPRYDLANDILTFGLHRCWYKRAIRLIKGRKILDCATGTGNLAILFKKKIPGCEVVGIDFSEKMVEIAKKKAVKQNVDVKFETGDALNLRFEESSFDAATISWGIRNTESPDACLKEMARVVKPGGQVIILEFGQPRGIFNFFYKIYQTIFIRFVGGILTGNRKAYNYLTVTTSEFPCREEFTTIMKKTGCFSKCNYKELFFGVAFIYTGVVKR